MEKGIFTKTELLGMVRVVNRERKEKRKGGNRRRLFL